MKRFILSLSVVAIILAVTVSCSKDETNNALPVIGNADLNGQKLELTYSLLSTLNLPPLPGGLGVRPPQYIFMLAGGMNTSGDLTQEPYLYRSINALPETGAQLTFDLDDADLSLRCILKNKEYLQHPVGGALDFASGKLCLQKSMNDIFYLNFDIRTRDGHNFSGTAKLNYIP